VNRIVIAAALGAVAVIAVIAFAARSDEGASSGGEVVALSGETIDGSAFDLADTRGKPTVVNFFASWCPPCNEEMPDLVAFAAANPGVNFIGVASRDDGIDEAKDFVSRYGVTYPVVWDPAGAIAQGWGVTGIPTTFFLDPGGVVRATIVGPAAMDRFEEELEAAM
jgi:thiol-disulfide isomerase/thioredoxin